MSAAEPPGDRLQRLEAESLHYAALRERMANLDVLDGLVDTLAGVLDVRTVVDRVSELARRVLPHDALSIPLLIGDGRRVRVFANSGFTDAAPFEAPLPDVSLLTRPWDFEIVDELRSHPLYADTTGGRAGMRSMLIVPVRLDGALQGFLNFFSRQPAAYSPESAVLGRRVASHVAMTLSHQRIAEQAERIEQLRASAVTVTRRADEASDRASRLEARVRELTESLDARTGYRHVIGDSPPWRQVLTQATQVAATESTVLLLGDSGTGKEVVARFVHRASARAAGPFIALNCAALPEQLLESELFGYERGAFTGATQSKPGQLEQASGGTLFLDEVAEMSLSSQAKFLRVLQEREFQRLGGTRVLRSDARVIAATNRDLQKAIARGLFREDLYYRLNVFAIQLPLLRERVDDILPLTDAFISDIGRSIGRPAAGISREGQRALVAYHWPGNVRELRNVLERAAILCDGGLIAAEHLALQPRAAAPPQAPNAERDLKAVERSLIERALQEAQFNKSRAAKALGVSRAQLYVRLRRHGLV